MIKAIILDVDGVIVGEKIGFNSPNPNPEVIARLKAISGRGIPVSLCTAKPHFSVKEIIDSATLQNLHITDGGSVIIDPIRNKILKEHILDTSKAIAVIEKFIQNHVYTEFYTVNDYYLEKGQISKLTEVHAHVLQKEAIIVDSLAQTALLNKITKIMPIAEDEKDKTRLIALFETYKEDLSLSWGIHPIALPHQFGIITAKGISKEQAVYEIAESENISPSEILAVGDSTSDWQFIKNCGYAAAMGNASAELKELVATKPEKHYFIGGAVDANGILDILDYFSL